MADEQKTAAPAAATTAPQGAPRGNRGPRTGGNNSGPGGNRDGGQRREGGPRRDGPRENTARDGGPEMIEKLVDLNRVSKTVKGGKNFSFAALVVIGDGKGMVGHGAGKAKEVPEAISKATAAARRNLVRIPLREGRTIHHDVRGVYGAGEVVLRTAPSGTGIIAGGPMRAIFEAVGMHDVVAKSVGTSNPHNMIKATFAALQSSASPRSVAARRGKKVTDIMGSKHKEYGNEGSAVEAAAEVTE